MENRQANVSNVSGSVISIGTAGSITNIQGASAENLGTLTGLLAHLDRLAPEMPLPPSDRDELQAEIQTARAQLGSPKPKQGILQESLRTIRSLLEGIAGNAIYSQLLTAMDRLMA